MALTTPHFTKTRIAPTPTGYLHLGNAYNFALTAALAHKHNAQILLRIDDLDHQRVNKPYVQDIFDTLQFLDIPWHKGPRNIQDVEDVWGQQHRMPLYTQALQYLRDNGHVFACSCSRSMLQQNLQYPGTCLHSNLPFENHNWRLITQSSAPVSIRTLQGPVVEGLPVDMQYFVVRKKDGYPAYQLTSVIDDLHFGVDLIVRGEDLWHSTLAQQVLAQKLQQPVFANITFHHHPLFTGSDGNKLSKSAGSTSIRYLRAQGKTVKDVYGLIGQMAGVNGVEEWGDLKIITQ